MPPMPPVAAATKPATSSIAQVSRIVLAAIAFRVLSAVLAFISNVVFPLDGPEQFPSIFGPMRSFWDPFTRYDGGWYYQIARNGYQFVVGGPSVGVGKPGKIAYFPVYPLLMRYAGRLFGDLPGALYFGGILVSWVAFVLAMVLLLRLAMLDVDEEHAERAVYLAAVFPFAFFFGDVSRKRSNGVFAHHIGASPMVLRFAAAPQVNNVPGSLFFHKRHDIFST